MSHGYSHKLGTILPFRFLWAHCEPVLSSECDPLRYIPFVSHHLSLRQFLSSINQTISIMDHSLFIWHHRLHIEPLRSDIQSIVQAFIVHEGCVNAIGPLKNSSRGFLFVAPEYCARRGRDFSAVTALTFTPAGERASEFLHSTPAKHHPGQGTRSTADKVSILQTSKSIKVTIT